MLKYLASNRGAVTSLESLPPSAYGYPNSTLYSYIYWNRPLNHSGLFKWHASMQDYPYNYPNN